MATRNEIDKFDNKLSLIQGRLRGLYANREEIEEELQQKGLKADVREALEARLALLDEQIKAAQKEEWDIDGERYDRLYGRRR
jgi:hypothetical protein